jgi:cell division transport system ATP-binding protein
MGGSEIIEFTNVTVAFPKKPRPSLENVSFTVTRGEFAYITGPSGSGKTTLFHLLLGYARAAHGVVRFDGASVASMSRREIREHRRRVGFVPGAGLGPGVPMIRENVDLGLRELERSRQRQAVVVPWLMELLGEDGLPRRSARQYTAYESRVIAISRALVHQPTVLLLDGPARGVDPTSQGRIVTFLESVNRTGVTVLAIMNNAIIVDAIRHRVISLDQGRLVSDRPDGLYA